MLVGCAVMDRRDASCPLPSEQRLAVTQLFFGREIPGRGPLSDAEWSDFAEQVITPQFPDGFTVSDGDGHWFDQRTGRMVRERSKILLVAADPGSDLAARIGAVVDAYRQRFNQKSVGVITTTECGAF